MPDPTIELSVGDTLVIGNRVVTVIEIDQEGVHFRIDDEPEADPSTLADLLSPPQTEIVRQKAR